MEKLIDNRVCITKKDYDKGYELHNIDSSIYHDYDEYDYLTEVEGINPENEQNSLLMYVPVKEAAWVEAELDIVDYDRFYSFSNSHGINTSKGVSFENRGEAREWLIENYDEAKKNHPTVGIILDLEYAMDTMTDHDDKELTLYSAGLSISS